MNLEFQARSVADVGALLGEGPVWVSDSQALYWVDLKGMRIFRLEPDGEIECWETPFRIGALAPRQSGGFIAGTDRGLAWIDPVRGRFEPFANPEPELPTNRFNDGKVDRAGRFWAGTMDDRETEESGALYRLDTDLSVNRVDCGYRVTNGPAFDRSGTRMYHNDSARQLTYVFDLDVRGNASNRRVFAVYGDGEGYPDGMTIDSEDCLWIAFWDGWCLRRYSPHGDCIARIEMPVQRPTSCAFGGPNLDRLYVSSASIGLGESDRSAQPCAGNLFMLDTGIGGLADLPFQG